MSKKINKIFFLTILLFGFSPWIVSANEIRFEAQKSEVSIGEQFFVKVVVTSTEVLNAIEANFIYPRELASLDDISDGDSVVNFWVEPPKDNDGNIAFSGTTPVGFSGVNSKLLTMKFTAKKSGSFDLNFVSANAYLNDGTGTKTELNKINNFVLIRNSVSESNVLIYDIEPPEDFTPTIISDNQINDGYHTLIFSTKDKGVGLNSYYIKEGKYSFYHRVVSPYLIKNQSLCDNIYIKAVDKNGNKRVVIVPAKNVSYMKKAIESLIWLTCIALVIYSISLLWKKIKQ